MESLLKENMDVNLNPVEPISLLIGWEEEAELGTIYHSRTYTHNFTS